MIKGNVYPLVSICIPFSRKLQPDWCMSLVCIAPPMNAMMEWRRTIGVPREEAREQLVDGAMSTKSRFALFLDDDVTVPPNIIRKLLFAFTNAADDVAVIGGIYCSKTIPAMPLVFKETGSGPFYKWQFEEVFDCEVVATGMMMIDLEKMKNVPKPWFKDLGGVEENKKYGIIPEDYTADDFGINDDGFFCHRVRNAGYKVMAHGGVLGVHWGDDGTAYLLPDNSYPMRAEMERRWGSTKEGNEQEYVRRYMALVRDVYGSVDLGVEQIPQTI